MYYHLPINIRSIGDCQAAECTLCARCSDVAGAAWTNITAFTSFSVLYLCVSNNLLTHTLLISKTAFILLYTCAKRSVFSINKRFPQGFCGSTLFLLRHLQRRQRRNRLAGAEEVNSRNTALFTNYFRCDGVSLSQRLLTLHILIRHTKIVTR